MTMNITNMGNAILYIIQNKAERYNKAADDCRFSQAKEYLYELKGMQEILRSIGIQMDMKMNDIGNLKVSIDIFSK